MRNRDEKRACASHGLKCTGHYRANRRLGRDIGIFGESGGYAFQEVGRYSIWAELRFGGNAIVSNRNGVARRFGSLMVT